jgi:hypothetical protein
MPEHGNEVPRGIDRRQFIRRSAIVGGNLLWMTPVVQSLTKPAYAHVVSPANFCCCECRGTDANRFQENCTGTLGACTTASENVSSETACQQFCGGGTLAQGRRRGYCFHCGPNPITCAPGTGCSAH